MRLKKQVWGIILLMGCSLMPGKINAQWFMTSAEGNFIEHFPTVRFFEMESCADSLVAFQNSNLYTGYTFHQNGSLYVYKIGYDSSPGVPPTPAPERNEIFKQCNGYNYLDFFPTEVPGDFNRDSTIEAIATGLDSIIYAAGTDLWSFAPNTDEVNYIGPLPPEWRVEGGMTLREGELYITTVGNRLVRLNTENPANSEELHIFPDSIPRIESLVTIPHTCDSIITYAFAPTGSYGEPSTLYELSFEDYSLTPICTIPEPILAAASMDEVMIPPCELYADLDEDDSVLTGLDYEVLDVCTTPVNISATNLDVHGQITIDSIVVELSGILDIGQEYLSGLGNINVSIQGAGTERVVLHNLGSATELDYEAALATIQYQNDTALPTYGQRQVIVTPYALYYQGSTSFSFINLTNEVLETTLDTLPSCYGMANGRASIEVNGGQSPYAYEWEDGLLVNERSDLSIGTHFVTISDQLGCYRIDTVNISQNDSLYTDFMVASDTICGDNGSIIALPEGGTAPYTIEWDGGASTDTLSGLGVGTYTLTLTDALGCTAEAAYTLYQADTIYTYGEETACEGNSIIWQGEEYTSDTTICIATTSFYGCDSIHCVDLIFQDSFYQEENFTLCLGEELNWQGVSYYQDTSICVVYVNEAGCDSTYCMNASFISRVNAIEASICEGDSFLFYGQSLTQAGTYTETISDGGFCDSLIVLELKSYPLPSVGISAEGSLCTDAQVGLNAEGTGAYQWSTGEVSSEIEVQAGGWYYLTLTDNNGCEATDSILLSEGSPNLSYVITPTNCPGFPNGSIQIDSVWGGNPPYLYAINESPLQGQESFTGLEAGSYTLTVEDADGCLRSYDLLIESASNLTFSLGDDIELSLGDSISLTPFINTTSGNLSIQWQPTDYLNCDTCIAPITKPFRTITYQAFLTDDFGCTLSDDITIVVSQKEGLFIPNAFSPNGDGRNDRLVLFSGVSILTIDRFQVFDRWGNLVFERKDFLPNVDDGLNWEGMIKGQLAPIGAYTYVTVFKTVAGEEYVVSGIVNLLR